MKALVHMQYYKAEAEILAETKTHYKVAMPAITVVDTKISPFDHWVPKENVELITEPSSTEE